MNSLTQSIVRAASLAILAAVLSAAARAGDPSSASYDRADVAMQASGSIRITSVGNRLKIGTLKSAVSEIAGRADVRLADGSWLFYKTFYVDHSQAHGSLVVSFSGDRVSGLRLVSPLNAVAAQAKIGVGADAVAIASR